MPPFACAGPIDRREFMRVGTLALGGLGLSDLLAARASAQTSSDTTVILFWMWGGPSQLETYDCKPDAPSEYRGPLRPIKTTVPGMDICEVFPLQAKLGHRISLVRSLYHQMSSHNDGSIEVLTGKTPAKEDVTSTAKSDHPDFGMIASRLRGSSTSGLPQNVGIPRVPFMNKAPRHRARPSALAATATDVIAAVIAADIAADIAAFFAASHRRHRRPLPGRCRRGRAAGLPHHPACRCDPGLGPGGRQAPAALA